MNSIKLTLSAVAGLGLIGCATGTTSKSPSASIMTEGNQQADSTPFTRGITPVVVSEISGGDICPLQEAQIQTQSWRRLIKMANVCVVQKKWAGVELIGHSMAKRDSVSPWGPYYLSLSAEANGDLPRALWMAELAGKKSPKNSLVLMQQGRVYWSLKDYSRAADFVGQAIKVEPRLAEAHLMLGRLNYQDGNMADASRHFEAAISLNVSSTDAYTGLAECRIQQGDGKSAVELLNRAISRQPKNLSFRLRLAQVYETVEKDNELALETYRRVWGLAIEKKLDAQPPVDLRDHIARLESLVRKSEQVSLREPSAAPVQGVKK